jgi:hypothetical protein
MADEGTTDKKRRKWSLGWLVAAIAASGTLVTIFVTIFNFVHQPDPAVTSYQKQVLATCGRVQGILSANHAFDIIDISLSSPQGPAIRKAGLLQALTNNLAEVRNEFDLLNQKPTPGALADKKRRVLQAEDAWYSAGQGDLRFFQSTVRDGESLTELNSQFASREAGDAAASSALSAALSDLAGSECRLRAPLTGGSP